MVHKLARKGDFVLVHIPSSSTAVHGKTTTVGTWRPGVVTKTTQGNVEKAIIGIGSASTDVSRLPRQIVPKAAIPGGDAFALVAKLRELTGEDYPEFQSLEPAKGTILLAMEQLKVRHNPALPKRRSARAMGALRNRQPKGREVTAPALQTSILGESLRIRKIGGYVQQMKYEDANDQKFYVHDFEDLSAFMYLCDSALGRCLVIVPGDGETPLWEPT